TRSQRCVLFSETGLAPIRWRRLELQLEYLQHCLSLPDSHLAHSAAKELVVLHAAGRKGWMSKLEDDLQALRVTVPANWDAAAVTHLIARLNTAIHSASALEIAESSKLDLLQTRANYRNGDTRRPPAMAFRDYLRVASRELRVALTKLLLSDHPLAVERLRWRNGRTYDIPRAMRLCRFCNQDLEDTLHALFVCRSSDDLVASRRSFWARVTHLGGTADLQTLRTMAHSDLFHYLCASETGAEVLGFHAVQTLAAYSRTPMKIPTKRDVESHNIDASDVDDDDDTS
ncbi:hypothetical protein EXIGLDRAFT_693775, partial [Exidia glandulosa HHB12029]